MAKEPNPIMLNILYPIIVAIILFALGLGYSKFEAYESLLDKLPRVEKDLENLNSLHKVKEEMEAEYKRYKRVTNNRIISLETKPEPLEKEYVDLRFLNVNKKLYRDSLAIQKNLKRTEYLKTHHN